MLSRLGFVGLWVAGSLLPGTLDLVGGSRCGLGLAAAQASEMQEQWRLLQDAQAAYQRGILAVQRGDSTAAETAWAIASAGFRRIIRDNPQRTDLYAPLADIQIRRGQPAAAYALLIQAVRAGTTDLSVRIQVVRALQAMRRPQKALAEAQELQRSSAGNPELMALVGEVAAEAGNADLAISELKRAVGRIGPGEHLGTTDGVHVRKVLARLLLEKQRAGEAVALLSELVRQTQAEPHDAEVQLLLGSALLRSGKPAEAVATLRHYLQGSPGSPRGQALLAEALAENGQIPAAIELLEKAGEEAEVLDTLGRLLLRRQPPDLAAAQAVLGRAAAAQPHSLRICIDYAGVLQQAQQPAKALAELSRCTAPLLTTVGEIGGTAVPWLDGPEEPQRALLVRSELEVKVGKFDEAMATLRAALQLVGPTSPMATALRGRLGHAFTRRGLLHLASGGAAGAAALADLQEGHKLQGSPATAQALALGLLGAGKAAEALQLLTPIVDTNPNDPRLLGAYGRSLRETGQLVESRQTLQKAEAMVTAAGAAPAGANVGLRAALRQELALTLMALKKPVEALRQLDGADETTQQLRAQANLVSARALFEQASTPPPGPPGSVPVAPRGTPDIHQVMFVTQAALKAGPAVLPVQRAEAKLWQVHVLHGTGQDELASKLLAEMAAAFDQPTLDSLLGPGGFAILQSRITLRGGEFYQGTTIAQQAIPRLPRDAARALQNALAFGYTSKAVEIANRGEYERANALFRAAVLYSQGGPPANLVRAQYNLAVLQILRNHPEEARAVLTKLDPQQLPEALIALGAYYDTTGDSRQALDAYRRYLQLLATSPAVPRPPYAEKVQQWIELLGRIYDLPVRGSLPAKVTAGRERPRQRPQLRRGGARLPAAAGLENGR